MRARRRGAGPREPAAAEGGGGEEYVVGQVADSLWPASAAPPAAPLSGLFAAGAPPVLVAVAGAKRERKRSEAAEKAPEEQSSCAAREPPGAAKKGRKKELSEAAKTLAHRESALERADEEEERKLLQSQVRQKKGASGAVSPGVVSSGAGSAVTEQEGKAADGRVNRRTVFVGNLPVGCTAQTLKSLFKEYGQIKSIRFRSLIPAEDTSSKKLAAIKHKLHPNAKFVNAYVVFKEECDAIKALNKNGTEIASGFHIRVDIAARNSSHDNKRSVFLGNLSYDISDDAVREHFSVCGAVVAVRIVRDRRTGLGKGFGYVLFENTDAVHLALKLNESVLLGRKIRVKRCGEKWKAPQKRPNKFRAPKDRVNSALKTKTCSNDSFVGEKAVLSKKSTKPRRLKSIPRNKPGKNK
ncbi:RNA-binding protein 34 [Rhynochetos jubatus]